MTIYTDEDSGDRRSGAIAFTLIYFTFFLDNVLLTVLVPIIPDWVREGGLEAWARQEVNAPLVALLNSTVQESSSSGGAQATVGAVLGAKAATQLLVAPLAASAVCNRGPAPVLRAATGLLALAALVFTGCSQWSTGGGSGAVCAGTGRAIQGAGAAAAGVSGLALAAKALSPHTRDRALAALLGAVALGVLVGYPFGGVAYALWNRGAPFLLIAGALIANLAMQYTFLNKEEYHMPCAVTSGRTEWAGMFRAARRGATGACVGAVLLTTSVMAALEPCLPLWITHKFHPKRWQTGLVFVPDSAGYLVATSTLGIAAKYFGAERVALLGQLSVGLAALMLPYAKSVAWLAGPHAILGAGLGAVDAALVPALVARHGYRVPALAALLQVASSAAYALGPLVGGTAASFFGFETTLRGFGVANLLYIGLLYQALVQNPVSEYWGASPPDEDAEDSETPTIDEGTPLKPLQYTPMH